MTKPIVPWMGGKSRLAKVILCSMPEHQTYVEPFCGGAAILFRKPPSKVEVINDLNGDLTNLYRVVKHHLREFVDHLSWALVSRQEFLWHKSSNTGALTDVQRAVRFYYLQKMSFGGKMTSRTFGVSAVSPPRLNLNNVEKDLRIARDRLSRVYVESLDWSDCLEKYDRPSTLHYLDPPYWQTTGYGVPFDFSNYEKMADLASRVRGKMMISINDHQDIRRVFGGFNLRELSINYTVSGGAGTPAKELLLTNF